MSSCNLPVALQSEAAVRRLHRARATVFDMFSARGYVLTDEPLPLSEFAARLRLHKKETLFGALCVRGKTARGRRVCAFFSFEEKVGIGVVRELTTLSEKDSIQHVVLAYASAITPFARARIDELVREKALGAVELFTFDQLQINPTQHIDVPPHTLLGREAAATLLESVGSKENLAKIQTSDAIARFHGAHRGQIFQIRRSNPEGVEYDAYRLVI